MVSGDGAKSSPCARRLLLREGIDDELYGAPKAVRFHRNEVAVFLSRIETASVASDREGYTPIRRKEQRAAMGDRTAKTITDWLEDARIVECDHKAIEGEKAFWWRAGELMRSRPRHHRIVSDPASLRAWDAIQGIRPGVPEGSDPVRDHLRKWIMRTRLDPGVAEAAISMIDDFDDPFWLKRQYAETVVMLFDGEPADIWGDYCEYGRYHSIITRMPGFLRPALRIDGRELVVLDCKALQPLIQAICASREVGAVPPDLDRFFEVYADGDIYAWLADEVLDMPCRCKPERDAVKEAWAHLVYGNPRKSQFVPGWTEAWARYQDRQETIAGWLERTKRCTCDQPAKKCRCYGEAARECQRFESRVMIQGVVRDLMERHPELPIVAIHDAIATTPEGIPIVMESIRRCWEPEGRLPRVV